MIQIDMHPTLKRKVTEAAHSLHMTPDAFISQVVADAILDIEDLHDAQEAMKETGPVKTLEEVERALGITRP